MPFLFDDYAVDTDLREIRRGTVRISAGPQVFDLLVYLIRNRHRVVSKDDLLGAVWQGRIVSESTLTSHVNALRKAIGDSGKNQKVILTVPRKGFRFVAQVREAKAAAASILTAPLPAMSAALALPDRPSIAVMPFINMSDDPAQDYFADGMTDYVITGLSHICWLLVIARNSSFTYKGRTIDVQQIGRELGVRYVLEGGVRHAGDRVRITARLIGAATGAHLWADRFDGRIEDIFDLQDRVTASVAGSIAPKLEEAETERAKRRPTENLNAYDYFLRGMASFYRYTKEANSEALHLFQRAIEIDPHFAAAYGMAARCYAPRNTSRWMVDRSRETAEATRLAWNAIELGHDDALALCSGGQALSHVANDPEGGVVFIDQARALNPNLASAWLASGWARVHLGDPEVAIAHFEQAMRLSPLDPLMFSMQSGMAFGHFMAGRNDEAAYWAESAWRVKPSWLPTLRVAAASLALAGHLDRAQKAMARLRMLDPAFRISEVKDFVRFGRPEDYARFEDGLRIAGLPD